MNKKQEAYDQVLNNIILLQKTLADLLEDMQELNRILIEES